MKRIIAPPLAIYAVTTIAGVWLTRRSPMEIVGEGHGPLLWIAGGAIAAASGAIALWARNVMKRAKTTLNPYKVASSIITDGPFAYTRNPMYLALLMLYATLALILDSLWMPLAGALYFVLMQFGVIPVEEQALRDKFGAEYEEYTKKVRRWV